MTNYHLRPGVSFCETSGRLIFLDVLSDRYFMLGGEAEQAFRAVIINRRVGTQAQDGLLSLRRSGLVVAADDDVAVGRALQPTALPSPKVSMLDEPRGDRLDLGTFIAVSRAVWSARRMLRRKGLSHSLQRIVGIRDDRPAALDSIDVIRRISTGFAQLDLLSSPLDLCLPRSIALTSVLGRRGVRATLVIGVKLRPFLAHSWVQTNDVLVNERHDVVRTFTPILVV